MRARRRRARRGPFGALGTPALVACPGGRLLLVGGIEVPAEAAEPGAVELDAMGQRRVLYILASGVQLIGLNITGGYSQYVS